MASNDPNGLENTESKTGIDLLIDLLQTKGRMDINTAASTLGVGSGVAENWAKLLERNSLVRISYEMGKMYIEPAVIAPEETGMEIAKIEVKKSSLEHTITEQLIDLNNFSHIVEELGRSTTTAESVYKQKIPEIQSMVIEVNRINDEIGQSYKEMENIKQQTEAGFNTAVGEINSTMGKISSIDSEATKRSINDSISKIGEAVRAANDSIITVDAITKSKEAELIAAKKDFDDQVAKINKNINESFKNVNATLQGYKKNVLDTTNYLKDKEEVTKGTLSELRGFDKKRALTLKKLSDTLKDLDDKHSKVDTAIDKRMNLLAANTEIIKKNIAEIKAGFGEASNIIDSITYVKKTVDSLADQIGASKAEIEKLRERLYALSDTQKKMSLEQKSRATEELEVGTGASSERINGIRNSVANAAAALNKATSKQKAKKQEQKDENEDKNGKK